MAASGLNADAVKSGQMELRPLGIGMLLVTLMVLRQPIARARVEHRLSADC